MTRHVGVRHAERIDADLYVRLPKDQRARHELENLINAGVGHRITADRHAGAVDHQIFTFITVCTVIGIREADINGFIEAAVRLELAALNVVEPFRTFEVALTLFWPQSAGVVTNFVTIKQLICLAHFDKQIESALFLEDLNINRRSH